MCKGQWGVHSEPRVPGVVGRLEREDDVHGARQIVADNKALVAMGVSKKIQRDRDHHNSTTHTEGKYGWRNDLGSSQYVGGRGS